MFRTARIAIKSCFVLAALVGAAAQADEASTAKFLISPDQSTMIVWNNEDDMVLGLKIAFAGDGLKNLDLVKPLMACTVKSGVKVVISEAGELSSDVLVLGGASHGCVGRVPNFYLHDSPS